MTNFLEAIMKEQILKALREQGYDVVIQQKKGMRNAYMESWPHIKGDIVLTFSPDVNSIPELIPDCINKLKEGFQGALHLELLLGL